MTTSVAKRIRVVKRGAIWLLVGALLGFLIYIALLATSFFDSKPVGYPDLEIESTGLAIPIHAALQDCPEWAAWEASEEEREEVLDDLRHIDPASSPADIADRLRPEVTRAIVLAEHLMKSPEMLCLSPQQGPLNLEDKDKDAKFLISVFKCLASSVFLTTSAAGPRELDLKLSALALRLLAKSRVIGGHGIIGRLTWLNAEESSHRIVVTELYQAILRGDRERCLALLPLLEACRLAGDKFMANALKGEFKSLSNLLVHARNQLGNRETLNTDGIPMPWKDHIEYQWHVLHIQPNRCVALLAKEYRIMIKSTTVLPCKRIWPQELYFPEFLFWSDVGTSLHPNAEGLYLLNIGHTRFGKTINFEDRSFARHQMLRLLIALALYRMDHGNKLPPNLGELVPGYLPDIPCDSFTGEPPIYDPVAGKLAFRGADIVGSPNQIDAEVAGKYQRLGLPAGVAGLFDRDGAHDLGVDLKAFFTAQ